VAGSFKLCNGPSASIKCREFLRLSWSADWLSASQKELWSTVKNVFKFFDVETTCKLTNHALGSPHLGRKRNPTRLIVRGYFIVLTAKVDTFIHCAILSSVTYSCGLWGYRRINKLTLQNPFLLFRNSTVWSQNHDSVNEDQYLVQTGSGTGWIAANYLNRPVRSRHGALCGLMTRFSLHRWDTSWWNVLLHPHREEEGTDKVRVINRAERLDRTDCDLFPHNQSINTPIMRVNLSSSVSVCSPVMICWTVVINVTTSPSVHLSGTSSAVTLLTMGVSWRNSY